MNKLSILFSVIFLSCTSMNKIYFVDPYEYQKLENHICTKPLGKIKSISEYNVNYTRYDYPNPNETENAKKVFSNNDTDLVFRLSDVSKFYDKQGLLVRVLENRGKNKIEYDYQDSKIKSARIYNSDTIAFLINYITDEYGRIIYENDFSPDNKIIEREISCKYCFDKVVRYEFVGGYNWGYEKELDDKGRVIKTYSLKGDKINEFKRVKLNTECKYLNDSVREKIDIDGTKNIEEINKQGDVDKAKVYLNMESKNLYREIRREYDKYGNLVFEEWFNFEKNDTTQFEYIYRFDKEGNKTYFARKSNFSTGSIGNLSLDWETFYHNEYYK